VRTLAQVNRIKVLPHRAAFEEVAAVAVPQNVDLIGVHQLRKPRREQVRLRTPAQDRVRVRVLPVDPRARLRRVLVLEPLIWVGDVYAVESFGYRTRLGDGRRRGRGSGRDRNRLCGTGSEQ